MGVLTLRARLVLVLAYVLVLAIGSMLVPLVRSVRDRVVAEVRQQAQSQAEVVAASAAGTERRGQLVETSAREVRGRVLIVDQRGIVIADSELGSIGEDYSNRPEIATALGGVPAQDQRRSDTLDQELLATAVPIVEDGERAGAVRITQGVAAVDRAVWQATIGLVLVGLIVLGLGLAAGALLAGSVAKPLRRLAGAARRAGEGDLSVRVPIEGSREQREVGGAFNEMTARVQRMVDAQRDFVADASHQLRTPLTGLKLRLEEAAATAEGPAAEQVEGALEEVDRLSDVVTELLVLSEAGAARPPDAVTDLHAAARRACERWSSHDVELSVSGVSSLVHSTPADVDRILDVLIENAIDYGPAGQHVRLVTGPGRVEVIDQGPGLAPGEEETIFARFHRGAVGRASRRRGTGLGLPIARELAGRWNGTVTLANAPGGGAVGTLTLPLTDGDAPTEPLPTREEELA
jgi:signal transduction histidine kinase